MQNRRGYSCPSSRVEQLLDGDAETGDSRNCDDDDDDDDDEETLQLKLAAIEARLKLKRIQQGKARSKPSSSVAEGDDLRSGSSVVGSNTSHPRSRFLVGRKRKIADVTQLDNIQVPLSPLKRPAALVDPVSPRRAILGIDKGIRGEDVSLRRPPGSNEVTRPRSFNGSRGGASSRVVTSPNTELASGEGQRKGQSFSEKIAQSRLVYKSKREKAENLQRKRSTAFGLDKDEIEHFRAAAELNKNSTSGPLNMTQRLNDFTRDNVLQSFHQPSSGRRGNKTTSSIRGRSSAPTFSFEREASRQPIQSKDLLTAGSNSSSALNARQSVEVYQGTDVKAPDSSKFEPFSSLYLSNRILPHSFLTRALASKSLLRIPDLLKAIKPPSFEPPDTEGDYVVFGIVGSKSAPKDHKERKSVSAKDKDPDGDGVNNTSKYMVVTLTDLQWSVDLFLFATAFPRYYKLSPGTLVAILNPSIMPPPPHKTDTNRFSLTLSSSDDTILEIGTAQDLGFCKAVKRDGKVCGSWVDARKTEFCEFHVNIQLRKAKARRMEVNSGPGILGPGNQSGSRAAIFRRGRATGDDGLINEGRIYDRSTGSTYYVTPQVFGDVNPHSGSRSAANLVDADEIFIAAGTLGRGGETKSERLRKRLADQEHERNLARKLGELGGVAGEYLRRQHSEMISRPDGSANSVNTSKSHSSQILSTSSAQITLGLNCGSRNANNVKLGPIKKRTFDCVESDEKAAIGKKTRFVTAKGIKEPGRESFGVPSCGVDSDDDDLDIV